MAGMNHGQFNQLLAQQKEAASLNRMMTALPQEEFSAKPGEDANRFANMFHLMKGGAQMSEDQAITVMYARLKGAAATWFEQTVLSATPRPAYDTWMAAFQQKFGRDAQTRRTEARQKLQLLQHGRLCTSKGCASVRPARYF